MLNYETREKVKALYRPIMADKELPMFYRIEAANHIFGALFNRSCESYLKGKEYPEWEDPVFCAISNGHPDSFSYIAMLLKQGPKALSMPYDVYKVLVGTYGKAEGISKGTYFTGREVNNIE